VKTKDRDSKVCQSNWLDLPSESFLSLKEVIEKIQSLCTTTLWDPIITGKKKNVSFLVDNTRNILRKNSGQRWYFNFVNDCGAWIGKITYIYLVKHGDTMDQVFQHRQQLCYRKQVCKICLQSSGCWWTW